MAASVSQASRCSALINTISVAGGRSNAKSKTNATYYNKPLNMPVHLLSMKVILFQINYVLLHCNFSQVLEYMYWFLLPVSLEASWL